jgi:hypothetical protein
MVDPPAGGESSVEGPLDPPVTGDPTVRHMKSSLPEIIADHIAAVNRFDLEAIVATFADDALVNDVHREFWGRAAITKWVAKEIVGDKVTMEVTEVIDHHGETIVRARYDGLYDKSKLPPVLILTNHFRVRDGKIVELIILHNTPPGY